MHFFFLNRKFPDLELIFAIVAIKLNIYLQITKINQLPCVKVLLKQFGVKKNIDEVHFYQIINKNIIFNFLKKKKNKSQPIDLINAVCVLIGMKNKLYYLQWYLFFYKKII